MQAMQVEEALEHADEWIKGVTLYEGAQGWRVACAALAAEVRRLSQLATCGCGDTFTEHDPGTCGNCMAGLDQTAEVERLREAIERAADAARGACEGWREPLMHEGARIAADAVLKLMGPNVMYTPRTVHILKCCGV